MPRRLSEQSVSWNFEGIRNLFFTELFPHAIALGIASFNDKLELNQLLKALNDLLVC